MKPTKQTQKQLVIENEDLRRRLNEAEETMQAIRSGDWDALVVSGADGEQIFTLRQSELRYRRLFEAAQDGILLLDARTGAITDVNPFLIKMLGYSREEFIKKKLWEVGAFKDVETSREAFEALQQNEYIRYENLPLKTKDGRLVPVEFVSNVYLVDSEKVIQCNIRDISARKQAEQALRESEKRFRALVENSSDAITMLDAKGIALYDSPAASGMLGYTSEDWIGKNVFALVHPEDLTKTQALFQKLIETPGAHLNSTFRVMHKSGAWLWLEIVTSNLLAEPAVKAMVLNYRDVTERKRMEDALRESEIRYRAIFENSQDAVLLTAPDGSILDVNPATCLMFGRTVEEIKRLGRNALVDVTDPRLAAALDERARTGKANAELTMIRADGSKFPVDLTSTAFADAMGQMRTSMIIRDITGRKQAEDALRESEERYRLLVETLPDGVVVHSQGRVIFANPASARLFGAVSTDDLIGKSVMDFVHPDYRELVVKRSQQSLSEGIPLPLMKEKFLRQDGIPIDVEVSTISFVYAGKLALMTVFNDITARLQAELALELAYSQLTNLYNNLPEAVFSVDLVQHKMLQASYAHEAIFGYPTDEFFKNPQLWYEIIIPEDKAIMDASYPLLSMGESVQQQFRILRPDGEMRWIESIIKPNFAENGKLVRFDGIASDITERKHTEEALRESERHYRQMIETAGEGIWSINAENHTTLANKRLAEMFGYSVEEIFEKSIFDFTDEEYQASARAGLELRKQGISTQLDFKFRRKNGSTLWALLETSGLYDQAGNYTGMLAMLTDITERKQGEENLRSAREFLQSVQDALSTHIAILDVEGNIVQVNAAWRNFGTQNGLSYSNYGIGINYLEICDTAKGLYATEAASVATAIRDVRDSEKREIWIEYPCHALGEQRWFIARITSFENNGQKWIVVAHENISERKKIEVEIQQRLNELEVLYQSGLAFSQLVDPKTIAEKIIDLLDQNMDWHHTAIRLYHPESETFELLAFNIPNLSTRAEHSAAEERLKMMQRPDQGLSGWAIRHSRAVRCNDLKNDVRYLENFPGLQSGLYVPIKISERVIGIISIESQYQDRFSESDERLIVTLAAQAAIAMDNAHLIKSLKHSNNDLTSAYDATIEGWSRALDLRDKETEGHSQRVTEMTLKLAQAFGLSNDEMAQVRWGALLHDIGKMGVPDGILLKPGPLTDEEWVTMKKHPTFAYEMLFPIRYLRQALDIPYCHHEKWDGSGYPRGLKGSLIPLSARIFAIVDVCDALSSDRPYRLAWPKEKVREHIRSLSGTHFDPTVVDVLLQFLN